MSKFSNNLTCFFVYANNRVPYDLANTPKNLSILWTKDKKFWLKPFIWITWIGINLGRKKFISIQICFLFSQSIYTSMEPQFKVLPKNNFVWKFHECKMTNLFITIKKFIHNMYEISRGMKEGICSNKKKCNHTTNLKIV